MSASLVLDASVAVAWVATGQATPVTSALRAEVREGREIAVPVMWSLEVANALMFLRKRGVLPEQDYAEAILWFADSGIEPDRESYSNAFGATATLALQHCLTVYDAAYLELAQRLQIPLATRDADLIAAATKVGVTVIDAR